MVLAAAYLIHHKARDTSDQRSPDRRSYAVEPQGKIRRLIGRDRWGNWSWSSEADLERIRLLTACVLCSDGNEAKGERKKM
jgi:hypothetical protein